MILIIGGRGAGKQEFARETLGCDPKNTLPALHELDPLPSLEELLSYEAIGRLCCALAREAQAVYRLQCGLAMRLK